MVVYKIDYESCYGNCIKLENKYIKIILNNVNDKIIIGKNVIPIERLVFKPGDFEYFRPGERKIIARLRDTNENVYIEYEGGKRIQLDYERYKNIYILMKTTGLKKLFIFGMNFKCYSNSCCHIEDFTEECFNEDYIEFYLGSKNHRIFTDKGVKEVILLPNRSSVIYKGECKELVRKGISLCYGNPE